ncbi:hypothetical protein HZS_8014, partial [Henneguya salminicola]
MRNGILRSLYLKNFLTYNDCQLSFETGLNIIYGPNGIQKSASQCKNVLKIQRCYDDSDLLIKRFIIKRAPRKSYWHMNGKILKENDIRNFARKIHVNVENLCNFLPQDRVTDFFKMNPQQLLIALQETIDNGELIDIFNKLVSTFQDKAEKKVGYLVITQLSMESKRKELDRLMQRQVIIQEEVKKYQEWKEKQDQIKTIELKLMWKKYEDSRQEYKIILEKVNEAQLAYDDVCKSLFPQKAEILETDRNIEKSNEKQLKLHNSFESFRRNVEDRNNSCLAYLRELRKAKTLSIERDRLKIENDKRLESSTNHLNSLKGDFEQIQNEINSNIDQIKAIDTEIAKHMSEYFIIENETTTYSNQLNLLETSRIQLSRQLQTIKDRENRVHEFIRTTDTDTYRALEWIHKNQDNFKSKFFDPLLLQIDLYNLEDAKYLENHVSRRDFYAFLSDNSDDVHIFIRELREKMSLKASCLLSSYESADLTPTDIPNLKNYKFRCYMKNLFNCPRLPMSFLCDAYKIHNIPIFDEIDESKIESVTSTKGLLSKAAVDEDELQKIQQTLDENHKKVQDLRSSISNQNSIMSRIKETVEELRSKKARRIENIKSLIEAYASEQNDNGAHIIECLEKGFEVSKQFKPLINEIQTPGKALIEEHLNILFLKNHKISLEAQLEGATSLLESQNEQLNSLKDELNSKKAGTKRLLDEAKRMSGIKSNQTLPNSLKQKFDKLSDNTQQLASKLAELQVLNASSYSFDINIMEKYDEIQKQTSTLTTLVNDIEKLVEASENSELNLKNRWLERIKDVIKLISENFQQFFSKMKCHGSIELVEDSTGNYRNFALGLMVSYRPEEKPTLLNHNRHSGGEKAVATMLFLMAIQQLSSSPFKMIDEINQGMDPINERTVFEIMVNTISNNKSANQYFFLSPKVLPELTYNDNITIHTIFNGPDVLKTNSSVLND